MSNVRKRTSAQRTQSKERQRVAAFNDMEARLEQRNIEAAIGEARAIEDHQPTVNAQFLMKRPFLSDAHKVKAGSEDERINMRYLMENALPRFSDREIGITLY